MTLPNSLRTMLLRSVLLCAGMAFCTVPSLAQAPEIARVIGTVTKVEGGAVTIASDSNGEVKADVSASTRLLRVAAGEKDLKNATAITIKDLQNGDRVLVRGQSGADSHVIAALAVIVMKQADVSERQKREREDWQRRGVGGLVSAVDAPKGTIVVSSGGLGRTRSVVVNTSKNTILRRYAPNSIKFADAVPAPLDQVKPGDQLLARGELSADGSSMTAEEIVSGTFRNIAGSVKTVDAGNQTVIVQDLIRKGDVQIKVSPDSQVKKIPAEFAQRIAMRLKAQAAGGRDSAAAPPQSHPPGPSHEAGSRMQGARNGPGGADLQRMLARLPGTSLADLHPGDAVMVVSTDEDSGEVRAITVLAGVEPILAAVPTRSASAALSVWTLGGPAMEGATEP